MVGYVTDHNLLLPAAGEAGTTSNKTLENLFKDQLFGNNEIANSTAADVTESQTASSFLQLLTNALHDQHQIYDFILQNKTIMAALVRNGFLNKYNTNFNMFPCVNTYKLTNDVGRTSKGKNQQYEYQTATKCSQCPR